MLRSLTLLVVVLQMLPSQAVDYCRKYNMSLANLETVKEVNTVYKYIEDNLYTSVSYYTSGVRRINDQSWTWSGNGKPIKYDYWGLDYDGSVQPNVPSNLEAWVYVYQGMLGDSTNNLARNFICEQHDKKALPLQSAIV